MEQLNRVELRGVVGSVRESKVADIVIVRLTVATNFMYKDNDGNVVIETTWHAVEKFYAESPGIQKGDNVWVVGRMKSQKYVNAEGEERTNSIVRAHRIEKIDEPLTFEV